MWSLTSRVISYESLDLLGQNFASLTYGNYRDSCFKYFIHMKSYFRENDPVLPIEKFLSLVLSRNAIMLQHLIIKFSCYHLSSGRLRKVKNKRKLQTFSSEAGRGRLREAVAYKRFQIYSDFGKLVAEERRSLMRGDRSRRFDCI